MDWWWIMRSKSSRTLSSGVIIRTKKWTGGKDLFEFQKRRLKALFLQASFLNSNIEEISRSMQPCKTYSILGKKNLREKSESKDYGSLLNDHKKLSKQKSGWDSRHQLMYRWMVVVQYLIKNILSEGWCSHNSLISVSIECGNI